MPQKTQNANPGRRFGLVFKKSRHGRCPLGQIADAPCEWSPVCAASVPVLHQCRRRAGRLCVSVCRRQPGEASNARQQVPADPAQRPGFVVPLCNAPTGFTLKPGCAWTHDGGVRADENKAILAAVKCIKVNDDTKNTHTQNSCFLYLIFHWRVSCIQLFL